MIEPPLNHQKVYYGVEHTYMREVRPMIQIEEFEEYGWKSVDSEGRLYLGKDYAGKDVKILIEEVRESDG